MTTSIHGATCISYSVFLWLCACLVFTGINSLRDKTLQQDPSRGILIRKPKIYLVFKTIETYDWKVWGIGFIEPVSAVQARHRIDGGHFDSLLLFHLKILKFSQ